MLIKQCPMCDRTYSDETLSYCLADGALLSAPYDSQNTGQNPGARSTNPPPTEVMRQGSTIASPFSPRVEKRKNTYASPEWKQKSRLPWILAGLFVALALSAVFIIGYKSRKQKTGSSSENANAVNPGVNSSPTVEPDANAVNSNQSAQSPSSVPGRNTGPGDGVGVGSGRGEVDDSTTVFRANEVSEKAKILSKPAPEYTEAARQNQVSGTVVLQLVLSSSGAVTNIRTISGLPFGLTEKAIAAARGIKFIPAIKDGNAVSQYVRVEYNFNLY